MLGCVIGVGQLYNNRVVQRFAFTVIQGGAEVCIHCYTGWYRGVHSLLYRVVQRFAFTVIQGGTEVCIHYYTGWYRGLHSLLYRVV